MKAGERLVLFYASANRDEDVFGAPNEFLIDRSPNPHLAFEIGEHFCMGAQLARKSQQALVHGFVSRVDFVEQAGAAERTASNLVPTRDHGRPSYPVVPQRRS